MKAAELRDLGADELGTKERDLTDQLFRMRIQKSMGQLEAPDKIRTVRRATRPAHRAPGRGPVSTRRSRPVSAPTARSACSPCRATP